MMVKEFAQCDRCKREFDVIHLDSHGELQL